MDENKYLVWEIADAYYRILKNSEQAMKNYCLDKNISWDDVLEEMDALQTRDRRRKKNTMKN